MSKNEHASSDLVDAVLSRILRWGEAEDAVRVVVLTSTRARAEGPPDELSDYDVILALEGTEHVLACFGTAVFRHTHGIPDQCPACGSYQIGLRRHPDDADANPVPGCRMCEWVGRA